MSDVYHEPILAQLMPSGAVPPNIGKRRRVNVWTSRRGTHLGSGHVRPRQQTGHMIASDRIHTNKLLQPGGRPHMGPCFRRDDAGSMSPDLIFLLMLAVRMAVAAGFVVSASVIAERSGPA